MSAAKLYIKKFYIDDDVKGGTRDLEIAKNWLKEGKEVYMLYSEDKLSSFSTEAITDIVEVHGLIIVKTIDDVYPTYGFDDNVRARLIVDYFFNKTTDEYLYSYEEANEAVKRGDNVRACGMGVRTSSISCFIDKNTFETLSGSVYSFVI